LRVEVGVGDAVAFVAPQGTTHAERCVEEILVAAPPLALRLVLAADREFALATEQFALPDPARVAAGLAAVKIDHAARMQRVGLRRHRHREELLNPARAGMRRELQGVRRAQRLLDAQPELVLSHRLACIEQSRCVDGLAGIGLGLGAGQAERVLRLGRIEVLEAQCEPTVVTDCRMPACAIPGAPSHAVVTKAVAVPLRGGQAIAARFVSPAPVGGRGEAGIAPRAELRAESGIGVVVTPQLDHPARGVAMQCRERPAQHVDAAGRGEREMRHLPLPIGHRGGNAVDVDPQAAHAERGARAEAADRKLGVLRVVLAIARRQPGNSAQGAGDRCSRALMRCAQVDATDRSRQVERLHATHARRTDLDAVERVRGVRIGGGEQGQGKQHAARIQTAGSAS
jgi:hypothetical protein